MNRSLALIPALAAFAALPAAAATDRAAVLETYAQIGAAAYGDAAAAAHELQAAVEALVAGPSAETMQAARAAWLAARVPYMQTEAFRFGNKVVDDWEGRVNSWPLDEGLIDYVEGDAPTDENPEAALNVIASPTIRIGEAEIDASRLDAAFIAGTLDQAEGIETNVATGYHAVEFLLWGQDLHGTEAGAGERPWTDYARGDACTHGNCDRRGDYLIAVTGLLVSDLDDMAASWQPGGAARAAVTGDADAGVAAMLTGIGSLSFGELAGERMKLGLLLHDPEEEHDCFSDNTANSAYGDGLGVQNVYLGRYVRLDGSTVEGPSLSALVAEADPALDAEIRADLEATMARLGAIKAASDGGMTWDMMLAPGNAEGARLLQDGVDALVTQTKGFERAITALGLAGIAFQGSDSLQ
jgi:putative iron-regulated protein